MSVEMVGEKPFGLEGSNHHLLEYAVRCGGRVEIVDSEFATVFKPLATLDSSRGAWIDVRFTAKTIA